MLINKIYFNKKTGLIFIVFNIYNFSTCNFLIYIIIYIIIYNYIWVYFIHNYIQGVSKRENH